MFHYPLKTPENQKYSDVFRGYKNNTLAWNGYNIKIPVNFISIFSIYKASLKFQQISKNYALCFFVE